MFWNCGNWKIRFDDPEQTFKCRYTSTCESSLQVWHWAIWRLLLAPQPSFFGLPGIFFVIISFSNLHTLQEGLKDATSNRGSFFKNECPLKFCTSLLCSTIFQADIIDASFIRVLQTHIVLHTARKFQSMSISKRAMNHRWELAIAVLATDVAWAFLSFSYLLFFEYLYCRNHTLAMFDPTAWLWLAIFTKGHLNILWKTYLRITE